MPSTSIAPGRPAGSATRAPLLRLAGKYRSRRMPRRLRVRAGKAAGLVMTAEASALGHPAPHGPPTRCSTRPSTTRAVATFLLRFAITASTLTASCSSASSRSRSPPRWSRRGARLRERAWPPACWSCRSPTHPTGDKRSALAPRGELRALDAHVRSATVRAGAHFPGRPPIAPASSGADRIAMATCPTIPSSKMMRPAAWCGRRTGPRSRGLGTDVLASWCQPRATRGWPWRRAT